MKREVPKINEKRKQEVLDFVNKVGITDEKELKEKLHFKNRMYALWYLLDLEREGKIGHEKQEDGFYKFVKK
jgi:hypothetical protein